MARLPDNLRKANPDWPGPKGEPLDSFLEGPAFDAAGVLHVVDISNGRILKLRDGAFEVVAEYDGQPNGLKFGPDGTLLVADFQNGLMECDPATGDMRLLIGGPPGERFKGLNDLAFDPSGNVFVTDQGASDIADATGRLYRLGPDGRLARVLGGLPSPNGVAVSPDGRTLYLALTRANAVWRANLAAGELRKVGLFVQLSGGSGGPDGIAVDRSGNIAVAHIGLGVVWLFHASGEPALRIDSPAGLLTSNVAFAEGRVLITESESGSILEADLSEHLAC